MARRTLPRILALGFGIALLLLVFDALEAAPDAVLLAVIMGAGGPAMAALAPVYLVRRLCFRGGAARTTGTVERCEGFSDDTVFTLTIRFPDVDGRDHVFTEDNAPRRPVGAEVPVLYDPRRPGRARLHRSPAVDVAVAAAMFLVGAVLGCAYWWVGVPR
ncbi:DUF3592 domain-containing protein [Spirillospora albida]|uniref:DUF3592 domain-containing protein n=1 Tax=Spirillospora albida TaxID=58123 RepID=UPI0004C1B9AD|nr:DUF3592 domain-containing protein [Spirillospora albida]